MNIEANTVFAENQDEYLPLPAYFDGDVVTSCWRLSFVERIKVLFRGRVFLQVLTFGTPLQPIKMSVDNPVEGEDI